MKTLSIFKIHRFAVSFLLGLILSSSALAIKNLKLSPPLVEGGNVFDFKVSSDNNWVVYRADQDTDNFFEVYSVPIQGNVAPVKLTTGSIGIFPLIIRDGKRVVYRNSSEIISVPIDGGSPQIKLVSVNGSIRGYGVSTNDKWIVYSVSTAQNPDDINSISTEELFSVPIEGGGAPVKLNGALITGGNVVNFSITPNGSRVVYRADQEFSNLFELYSVPINGGSKPIKISTQELPEGSAGNAFSFRISSDGSRVVYLVRVDQNKGDVDFDFVELYSAPVDGGSPPVRLNNPLVTGGNVDNFWITPDGSRVVYTADQDTDEVSEIFSAPIVGGATPVKLNAPLVPEGDVVISSRRIAVIISSDSRRVVYLADQDTDGISELYSVSIDGTPPVKLNATDASGSTLPIDTVVISPDSSRVVYTADDGLYSVPIGGGSAPVKLNTAGSVFHTARPFLSNNKKSPGFSISPDSNRVVYVADQDTIGVSELFSVPIEGGEPIKLNGLMVAEGDILTIFKFFSFIRRMSVSVPIFSPDGKRVVYRADQDTDGVAELYVSTFDSDSDVNLNELMAFIYYSPSEAINHKIRYKLIMKLISVEKAVCKGNFKSAIRKMRSFIRKVKAKKNKGVDKEIAEMLIYSAKKLIEQFKFQLTDGETRTVEKSLCKDNFKSAIKKLKAFKQ